MKKKIVKSEEEFDDAKAYDDAPQKVKNILNTWDEDDGQDGYERCRKLIKKLEKVGWTMDYGLSAETYHLRKIK